MTFEYALDERAMLIPDKRNQLKSEDSRHAFTDGGRIHYGSKNSRR